MPDLRATFAALREQLAQGARLEPEVRADAAREARLLLAGVLRLSPGELALRFAQVGHVPLDAQTQQRVQHVLERRLRGEPLAYCVGHAPFRDLVLAVDDRVLIPRPETEIVVEEALRLSRALPGGVGVDIGTGSGAIALSLATEGCFARVIATDVSLDALAVARTNAASLDVSRACASLEFRQGTDLRPLRGERARVIVANPPYIAYEEAAALPASVRDWEPAVALYAPDHGMARYHVLLAGAGQVLESGGWLVCELDARRARETATRAVQLGYMQVQLVHDLSGRERVLLAQFVGSEVLP